MSTTHKTAGPRLRFHINAYRFLFAALRVTQERLGRDHIQGPEDEAAHISGQELLAGVRELATEKFGLLAETVFHHWGIHSTDDFGRMVFELIERGEMRKTEHDQLSDFYDVYDFHDVFYHQYQIDVSEALTELND